MRRRTAWVSWSSGKDSAWALHRALSDPSLEVRGLLTTVTAAFDRVSMHGVRRRLLETQARRLRLPVHTVELPWPCPNPAYEAAFARALECATGQGITAIVFGDLFLEDVSPDFTRPVDVEPGERVLRDGFWFADLLP